MSNGDTPIVLLLEYSSLYKGSLTLGTNPDLLESSAAAMHFSR